MTREECLNALKDIIARGGNQEELFYWACGFQKEIKLLTDLIEEHFSNPPLYMDEIPKGIWIWDNVNKECIRSLGCVELDGIIYVKFERSENSFITNYLEYEPNRFYRKEVRNVK
jgi:hypothetical protein|nr:MAG TPA: hypothetical protein [Caudoviricetes sp.]